MFQQISNRKKLKIIPNLYNVEKDRLWYRVEHWATYPTSGSSGHCKEHSSSEIQYGNS